MKPRKHATRRLDGLEYWQKRAFREWAFRPRPMLTYARMLLTDVRTMRSAIDIGLQHLLWRRGRAATQNSNRIPNRAANGG